MRWYISVAMLWPWPQSSVHKFNRVSFTHFSFSTLFLLQTQDFKEQMKNETENLSISCISVLQQNHNAQSGSGTAKAKCLTHTHAQGGARAHRHRHTRGHEGSFTDTDAPDTQAQTHRDVLYRYFLVWEKITQVLFYVSYQSEKHTLLDISRTKQFISFGKEQIIHLFFHQSRKL